MRTDRKLEYSGGGTFPSATLLTTNATQTMIQPTTLDINSVTALETMITVYPPPQPVGEAKLLQSSRP
jgi:hypothetical protein